MAGEETAEFPEERVDTVRASRDGHSYHEAWAARSALELLPPGTSLRAIAIEGFSKEDANNLSNEAAEIADTVRYHGEKDIARASLTEVIQFKYSISHANTAIRAADLKKTVQKFARTDADLRTKHGGELVEARVRYVFATNRPINTELEEALAAAVSGAAAEGDAKKQLGQISEAVGAKTDLASFIRRFSVAARGGSLREVETHLRQVMASWSAPGDLEAERRLLRLRSLVREKAGSAGQANNLIDRVGVLAEFSLGSEDDLYPTPASFPPVAHVVARPVVDSIILEAKREPRPLIVHAAGGMGKTVLMQALSEGLRATDHVVVFDGFGAGRWREPADGRHLPNRTLVHLANLLAGEGICDILLPSTDDQAIMRAFRNRLTQSVASVKAMAETAGIVLVLDAIDHAGMAANDMGGVSFAHLLLKSLAIEPIPGVTVIASCRTERRELAVGDAPHREFEIPRFTPEECRDLILLRDATATSAEIAALERRSGSNPRCLDTLLTTGRPYEWVAAPSAENESTDALLDELLKQRFQQARERAESKGAKQADLNVVFSGLAMLPPPVPIEELAAAQGLTSAEVESFVSDLAPLIERTPHGLMFRDEPTETLIREAARADETSRQAVVERLRQRQDQSDYAARALPTVLTALGEREALFELAFDTRVPPGASKISQRDIRLARIIASLSISAGQKNFDEVLRLLLEASVVAAGHERSDRFLYDHPDLAAVAGDSEALRRLFETRTGWAGGRHSGLAIANAFIGDMTEARRNANRAIDWFNWSLSQPRRDKFTDDRFSKKWDDVGFAYFLVLDGQGSRVARWFAQRSESDAYEKFTDLLDLHERHLAALPSVESGQSIQSRLSHCRLQSRSLFAAALAHCDDRPTTERLLRRLAKCPAPAEQKETPRRPLLLAAASAISLGLKAESRAIFDAIALSRPREHDYSSFWPMERSIERWVIAAGVKAALTGKKPALLDFAPIEFIEAVPPSAVARGPAAFGKALNAFLKPPTPGNPPRRRRKGKPDFKRREEYSRTLAHRIDPLIPFAEKIAQIISAKEGPPRTAALAEGFDYLVVQVEGASTYPYRDGKAYIARAGFAALFAVGDRTGAITRDLSKRFVDWLKTAPGFYTPELISLVGRLARREELQDAALDLAVHTESRIQLDTETESRISSYGSLARAVWLISIDEAAAYFRRALDLTEAIGSEDFHRTNSLLALLGTYTGELLPTSAGYTFARIVELNLSDAGKFPWVEFAEAIAATSGLSSLSVVSRLDDRDAANLYLTLGPLLTVLTGSGKLPAEIGVCLYGLASPRESYTWRYDAFARAAIPRLPNDKKEWAFGLLILEMDREDGLEPYPETVSGLRVLAEEHLPANSPSRARLEALATRRPVQSSQERTIPEHEQEIFDVDLGDPDAIDSAIDREAIDEVGNRWPGRILNDLVRQPSTPGAKLQFVRAVVKANEPSLADKVRSLEDHVPDWSVRSAALRDELPIMASELAEKHALELVGSSWEADSSWRALFKVFRADRAELVRKTVLALTPLSKRVSGDAWLALAVRLAPIAGSVAFKAGLERLLEKSAEGMPAEVGDGPWRADLETGDDPVDVTGDLLWSRLGHPRPGMRWRAAHAVRNLANAGQWAVIDRLVARYDADRPSAYQDAKYPFYAMHAQLWLLIALARVALDHPAEIVRYRQVLENVAFNDALPHIVMRHFAASALRCVLPLLDADDGSSLEARLDAVNASPFAPVEAKAPRPGLYAGRPEGVVEPPNAFHMDYDFNKYQASDVGDLFCKPGWDVDDAVTGWVRRWDGNVRGMYECPRLGEGSFNEGTWSSGAPNVDRYGGYLGWHALMLTAGEFLAKFPICNDGWKDDPLGEFISENTLSRSDGLWMADATDLFPLDVPTSVSMPEADAGGIRREDQRLLLPMLTDAADENIIVFGDWKVGETDIAVRTVLANKTDARAIQIAAMDERPFHRWMPHGHDVEYEFGKGPHSVRNWIVDLESSRRLDRHDPYACSRALQRPRPEEWLLQDYGLSAADPIHRLWTQNGEVALAAEAWGNEGGQGDYHWERSGERLKADRPFLLSVLRTEQVVLVGFIKARSYNRDKSDRRGGRGTHSHRAAAFTVDVKGQIAFLNGVPQWAQDKLAALDSHQRNSFRVRFEALRQDGLLASKR